jgi:hypothetical protein
MVARMSAPLIALYKPGRRRRTPAHTTYAWNGHTLVTSTLRNTRQTVTRHMHEVRDVLEDICRDVPINT